MKPEGLDRAPAILNKVGMFRIWVLVSGCWIMGAVSIQNKNLVATKPDYSITNTTNTNGKSREFFYEKDLSERGGEYRAIRDTDYPQIVDWTKIFRAWAWVLIPPIGFLLFGMGLIWTLRAFLITG